MTKSKQKRTGRNFARTKYIRRATWIFLGCVILGAAIVAYFIKSTPSIGSIANVQVVQSTKIYDRTGKTLLYEVAGEERRTVIPFEEIPQATKDAAVAIEDERFYEESAFSVRGIVRAFVANLTHGRVVQGGSTITQQLAKNAFLTADRTIVRKIREFVLAIKLSRYYSKDEILGLYLNEVPYGPTLYGIEAASRAYFGKSARDLTAAESALLAGLTKAPSYYNPWGSHVSELLERQRFILKKMRELGMLDDEELGRALDAKLVFLPQQQRIQAPHFVIAVQEYLSEKYGEETVSRGGLRVVTTLDTDLQLIAEKAVADGAKRNEELYQGKNAALVAQDPKTGQVLAMVGSRDYFDVANEGNFNVATQGLRQPGSALKPFAYLTAFTKGYAPESAMFDVPTEFAAGNQFCPPLVRFGDPDTEKKMRCFHPKNFDGHFRGPINLRTALAQSVNVPAVKALYLAGLEDTLKTLERFGVTTLNQPARYGLSLVLGGGEVRLIELVNAYATLAQDGVRHERSFVLEVRDANGDVLESWRDNAIPAEDARYVRLVNDILSDTDARSGLFRSSLPMTVFSGYEVALKTGTTDDYRDAWAIGYTPSLAVGVWAGNNDNAPMQAQGSSILAAVPIWNAFMKEAFATGKFPAETFARPDSVSVTKPILRGDYAAGGAIHSELYFIDRSNPDGPIPQNPQNDPQFVNWETAVLAWAERNPISIGSSSSTINPGNIAPDPTVPQIFEVALQEPAPGTFIGETLTVRADIRASAGIAKIRLSFNNTVVQELNGQFGSIYPFAWTFNPPNPLLQNTVKVEVIDALGKIKDASVIVYK